MIKNIALLKSVPNPQSPVVTAALNLLSTFGDPKKLSALLTEMRQVQEHNITILEQTKAAIGELNELQAKVEKEREDFASENQKSEALFSRRGEDLTRSLRGLEERTRVFQTNEQARLEDFNQRDNKLKQMFAELQVREQGCSAKETTLVTLSAALDAKKAEIDRLARELQAREARLRAFLDT